MAAKSWIRIHSEVGFVAYVQRESDGRLRVGRLPSDVFVFDLEEVKDLSLDEAQRLADSKSGCKDCTCPPWVEEKAQRR